MPDGLYERDALAWADHQAALLRRVAVGERLAGKPEITVLVARLGPPR